jgi:tetratricopeptide (TPR) repeat protein
MEIDEFPKSCALTNDRFKRCINIIIETVKIKIWNGVTLIPHYTKHGIDHSERIIQCLGKLLEDFPILLNQQERFVLLAAIYLHDIGNQLPKYVGIPIKSAYSLEEKEKIRKNHHLSSCEAVKDSIKSNAELSLGLDICKEYTEFIALLCKYHRKLDLKYLKDTSIAGDPLRLPLLGALLRLGDELDADYRRVDMEVLNIIDIPTKSKFYWWSHHYIQSISIDHGHIKLFFRFPEEYKNNNIVEVFQTERKESLRKQFLEVYDIFENYRVRFYRDIEMGDTNYLSSGSLKPVPPDLSKYINITITQTGSNYKELSLKTGVIWEIDGGLYSDNERMVEALIKISQLMKTYKYKEAVKIIEDTYLLTMSPKDRMIFSGIAGICYYFLSDFEKAKSYYMDQLKLTERRDLKKVYPFDTILNRSASLGNIGIVYRIQGKLMEALNFFQQALEIHRGIDDKEGETIALDNIGNVYRIQGKLTEALNFFQQALDICRKIGYKKGKANALDNIGIVYGIQNKLTEALNFFQQALDIYLEIGAKEGEASALDNIGIIYRQQDNLDEALQHYQQALDIYRKIGDKKGEAYTLGNMGIVYLTQNKLTEALKFFQQSLDINQEIGDKGGEAKDFSNIGVVCQKQRKLTEALDHYQQALDIDRKVGDKRGEAKDLGNMGSVYQIQGKLKEALDHFKEVLEIYKTLEDSTNIKKINKIIEKLKRKS